MLTQKSRQPVSGPSAVGIGLQPPRSLLGHSTQLLEGVHQRSADKRQLVKGKHVLRGVREDSAPEVTYTLIVLVEHDEQLGALVNLRGCGEGAGVRRVRCGRRGGCVDGVQGAKGAKGAKGVQGVQGAEGAGRLQRVQIARRPAARYPPAGNATRLVPRTARSPSGAHEPAPCWRARAAAPPAAPRASSCRGNTQSRHRPPTPVPAVAVAARC
eukprot:scaffold93731_cov78-Phaeocystis_antarctica.AAC.4